jgi:predicted DNA-binding transcriptional regulator YafY
MTSEDIKYIYTYKKKDGTIRDIKTNKNSNGITETHIIIWDCENNGWRTLIKDRIQEIQKYQPIFTYKKLDGKIRDIKTDGIITKVGENNIRVWDIQNNGWRTLIKDRIQETVEYQTITV